MAASSTKRLEFAELLGDRPIPARAELVEALSFLLRSGEQKGQSFDKLRTNALVLNATGYEE